MTVRGLHRRLGELLRFGLVGGATFALDLGALFALRELTALPLALDAALAFGLAAVVNFVLSRQWVFPEAATGTRPAADFLRYAVLVGAGLLVTTVTVPLLAWAGLDYRIAKLVASGLVAALNFVVMPRWVFRGPRPGASAPRGEVPDLVGRRLPYAVVDPPSGERQASCDSCSARPPTLPPGC
jgi:putative flippase GtrA